MTTTTTTAAQKIAAAPRNTTESDKLATDLNAALAESAQRDSQVTNPATAQLAGVTAKPGTTPKRTPRPAKKTTAPKKSTPAAKATPAPAPKTTRAEPAEPANPQSATVDILIAAFADALKTQDAASVRKLVLAAQRRATDPKFVPNSSPSQRSKHSATKLATELLAPRSRPSPAIAGPEARDGYSQVQGCPPRLRVSPGDLIVSHSLRDVGDVSRTDVQLMLLRVIAE